MATEQAFPSSAPIVGGGRLLPTPAQFYVTGEDRLRIVSANAMAGVSLQLHWRHAEPSGRTVPNAQTHTPASDRSIAVTDYPLGVGSLLNVTVFAGAGAPKVGQTYVMVQLVRGTGASAIVLGTLLAGYVTSTQALGWPGSPIAGSLEGGGAYRSIAGATPAPGVDLAETVPTGARWELQHVFATLATSAVAGNRVPYLRKQIGGSNAVFTFNPNPVPAVTFAGLGWAPNIPVAFDAANAAWITPLAQPLVLQAGDVLNTFTFGLQAGDQWGNVRYTVREWLEVS